MKTIGVIGLGSIGARHARNLKAMGHKVISHDPGNQLTGDGILYCPMPETVYRDADAIVIASPTPRHYFDIVEALDELKPTFCEKPIADRMPLVRDTFNLVTMVGYNLRFHSCVKKAKEWLDAGLIGKPIWANFTLGQFSEKPPYLRDGVILNWSHEIDLALYLLGNASVAASNTRLTDGKDDMTDILLNHERGCRSTVHLDYLTKPEQRYFNIIGNLGSISVDLVAYGAVIHSPLIIGVHETFKGSGDWNETYIEEMQAFIDRIDGKETIGCTGEEGLKVLEICLEVRKQAGL